MNPSVNCPVYKNPALVHIPSRINLVRALPASTLRSNLILSSHLYLGLPTSPLTSGFPTKTFYAL